MPYDQYETVIGLEVHVQLATASKAFCADDTRFGQEPNTQVSSISLGHPGTLPRLNDRQVAYAVRLGLALGSRINQVNTFDRKNYFYADLPKGYQITQDRRPVCVNGALPIRLDKEWKLVRIHHIHMEEDAGKSIHTEDPLHSLIDLNRAGMPLLEIVTEPDLRSAEEVDAFMSAMRQMVRYLGISDGNMEEGSMRCDVNVSIRPKGSVELRERCEIKNVNSMRYARQAIEYEVRRQVSLVESGGKVEQQTLNFDPVTGVTSPLREKEDAHDYRYFPEPDLPPVILSDAYLETARKELPALPKEVYQTMTEQYGLSDYDAALLSEDRLTGQYFFDLCTKTPHYKSVANLLINRLLPYLQENRMPPGDFPLSQEQLADFIALIESGQVSNSMAYQRIFPALVSQPQRTALAIAQELNLLQSGDADFLSQLAGQVLAAFPDKVEAYKKGKKGLLGFFMGELMKRSKGKADPAKATQVLQQQLEQ